MAERRANEQGPSGLDMGPTIAWYTANKDILNNKIPALGNESIANNMMDNYYFSNLPDTSAIIGLFPPQARQRSRLNNNGFIIGQPTLYFAKNPSSPDHFTTPHLSEALSPTAIIPSSTENAKLRQNGKLSSDILLYELPNIIDPPVQRIIHAKGLTNEFAHTIISQAFVESYRLKLPGGEIVNCLDYLIYFAQTAEKYPPISHYSGAYRKDGEEIRTNLAIEEEMAETIAAYLLGFAYCKEENRRLDPLSDRPDIKEIVVNFLHAEEVK